MSNLNFIKEYFVKRKLDLDRTKRKPILKNTEEYENILVVSNQDKTFLLSEISSLFKQAKIHFLSERENKVKTNVKSDYTYHASDLNLTGHVKNDKLNQLFKIEFDLILDLSQEKLLTYFFITQVKSSFLIGKKTENQSFLHDLMVEDNEDEAVFLKNVEQQITLLTKNGKH